MDKKTIRDLKKNGFIEYKLLSDENRTAFMSIDVYDGAQKIQEELKYKGIIRELDVLGYDTAKMAQTLRHSKQNTPENKDALFLICASASVKLEKHTRSGIHALENLAYELMPSAKTEFYQPAKPLIIRKYK